MIKRLLLGKYIPGGRLPILKAYKYQGVDKSLTSKYVLSHFWEAVVRLVPPCIAPNLITLTGFALSFSGFVTVLLTSHYMTVPCPSLVQFYIAFVLFAYMTFDAIDGKQARRTGTCSPLGQLFDHGCDAVNLIFTVFMTWAIFDLRPSLLTSVIGVLCYLVFAACTWEEYHTHVLFLGTINGPVEGVLLLCGAAIISGILGPQIWHHEISLLNRKVLLHQVMYAVMCLGTTGSIAVSLHNAIKKRGLRTILPSFIAIVAPLYGCLLWFGERGALWNPQGYVLFLLHAGFTTTNHVFNIIIATVTRSHFPYFILPHVTILFGLLHCALGRISPALQLVDDHQLLFGCAVVSGVLNIRMALSIIDQLCSHLGISCLTIKHHKPELRKKE